MASKQTKILNPPTQDDIDKISHLASQGVTQVSIAHSFGICHATYCTRKRKYPVLQDACDSASAYTEELVVGKLFKIINDESHKSHFSAVIFYLKAQCGWRDREATVVNNFDLPKKIKTKIAKPPK